MLPLSATKEAVDDVEQSGLAGAVRADDAVDCPGADVDVDVVDRLEPAEGARYAVEAVAGRRLWPTIRPAFCGGIVATAAFIVFEE